MSEAPTFTATDDVPNSGTAIGDDIDGHDDGSAFDDIQFTASTDPLPDDEDFVEQFLRSDEPSFDEPDSALLEPRRRPPNARKYERKVAGLFSLATKVTATQPHLMADSAALLMYGPDVSEKIGDLAATNASVARGIEMLTDQTESPALAVIIAATPLVLQLVRNHEPIGESQKPARAIRIPFTKKQVRFKIGFRLGRRMRGMTQEPKALERHVFTNPSVVEALRKQGISVEPR